MWNYQSTIKKSTGYEDVLDTLKSYTGKEFKEANEDRQQQMVNEVFDIYRGKNIFPVFYFNDDGIKEEIQKCIDKDIDWDTNVLNMRYTQGSALCKFMFPNLHKVEAGTSNNNSMYARFMDDHKLKRAIKLSLSIKKSVTPSEIFGSLQLIGGNVATNFPAMKVKALVERYTPKGGIVYDFAAGFGGRMLGVLSSKNDYKYVAVEPCGDTIDGLVKLNDYITDVCGSQRTYLRKCGSEEVEMNSNVVDFAFSSPPYFNLERYSDEDTQCYVKYPTLESWFNGYVKPTIDTIYKALKPNHYYAVNIADFNMGKTRVEYVDKWIELSKQVGFEYVEKIDLKLTTRKGVGHKSNGKDKPKQEGIFVFKK